MSFKHMKGLRVTSPLDIAAQEQSDLHALPALMLVQSRERAARPSTWSAQAWLSAVDASTLRRRVKMTLVAMLETSGYTQLTDVDRETIARLTGISRVATITDHWHRARDHGLLASRQRFNGSSRHKLTIPGLDSREIDDMDMSTNTNTHAHVWTSQELEWWQRIDDNPSAPPPWGVGRAPF